MNEEQRKKLSEFQKKRMKKRREAGLKRYWARRRKEAKERRKKLEKDKIRKAKIAARKRQAEKKAKVGRKKKTGPKINWYKRRKAKLEKLKRANRDRGKQPFIFMIMLCRNGKKYYTVGKYRTSAEAYEAFKKQREISDAVVFPRSLRIDDKMESSIDECIMIQKTDSGPTMLRNEYGKLVEHRTDLEGWEVVDKFKNNIEETFWVWGYDNRKDRKTFMWIYDEILIGEGFGAYEFRRIFTYRNKLFIRHDNGKLDMVICKSDTDAVRMYNEFQTLANDNKVKQLIFIGDRSEKCPETEKLENEIMAMTGWSIKKTRMNSTTYVLKN